MIDLFEIIFMFLSFIVYYLFTYYFNIKKNIKNYEKETKSKGCFNQNDMDKHKKYFNARGIASTIMFVGIVIGIEVCDYFQVENIFIEIMAVAIIGGIFGFISNMYVDKKYKDIIK
ncbi:hypothetical protein [Paraclostridium bifermentans]|uniref:hypothetical protein n=1 Tax=Paraclostridium bifermentans TaxID=1490 RepID=UPI00359C110A